MNHRTLFSLAALGLFALLGWSSGQLLVPRVTIADEAPASDKSAPRPCDIAIVDIGKVFKEHAEHTRGMELLKNDVAEFQAKLVDQQAEHKQMVDRAKTLKEGTEPRLQEDLKAARLHNELELAGKVKQKQLMEAEAKLYHQTYVDVTKTIAVYAKAQGYRIVLRYNSEPINPDDRNSVLSGVNNAVVFQDGIDITAEMIRRVNNLPEKS